MDASNQVTFSLYIVMAVGQLLVVMLFAWGILLYKYRKQSRQQVYFPDSVQNQQAGQSEQFIEQEIRATQEFLAVIDDAENVDSADRAHLTQSLNFRLRYLQAEQAASEFSDQHNDAYWRRLSELLQGTLSEGAPDSLAEESIAAETQTATDDEHAQTDSEPVLFEDTTSLEEAETASMAVSQDDASEEELLAAAESELDAAPVEETAEEVAEAKAEESLVEETSTEEVSHLQEEASAQEEDAPASTNREVQQLTERNDALKNVIENQEQTILDLKNDKQEFEDRVSDLTEQNEFLKSQRKNLQLQIERLQATMDELNQTINEQQKTIASLRQASDNTAEIMSQLDSGSEKGNEAKNAAIENMQLYTKMLEDDNDRLRVELDNLKGQVDSAQESIANDSILDEAEALLEEEPEALLEEDTLKSGVHSAENAEKLFAEEESSAEDTGLEEVASDRAVNTPEPAGNTIEVNIDLEHQAPNESAYAAADTLGRIAGAQLTALDEIRTKPEYSQQQWLHGGVERLLETITPVEMTASALTELAEKLASHSAESPQSEVFMAEMDDLLEKLEEKERILSDSNLQVLEQEKAALSALLNESARSSKEMLRCIHSLEDEVMSLREKTNSGVSDAPKAAAKRTGPLTLEPSGDPLADLVEEVQSQSIRNDVEILDLDEPLAEMDEILKDL